MGMEIERKFLVASDAWRAGAERGRRMTQGYLSRGDRVSVRIRVAGEEAWFNIKQAVSLTVRREYEYAMPLADARELLEEACEGALVDKTRYHVHHEAHLWEVDVFHGDNEGLLVAEVELQAEDEHFARPAWLGEDVSEDPRYLNQCLARRPWREWGVSGEAP